MNAHTQQIKVFSLDFIKAYLITMRPYLLFLSGATGLAGLSIGFDGNYTHFLLVFIASFLSYGFGQALTDCFQTDTDSISSPYRPLTQGIINKKAVLIISVSGLLICTIILSSYFVGNLILGLIAGLGLLTYTYFKKRWWAGPFYNAWIVVVLAIMAGQTNQINQWNFGFNFNYDYYLVLAVVFFAYANFVLTGYFKDIEADRQTGYNTLLVKYGRRVSAITSDTFALLQVIALKLYISNSNLASEIFGMLAIWIAIYAQYQIHKVKSDPESYKAISPVVLSYILSMSAISLRNNPDWLIFIISFNIIYIFTIIFRPEKSQI